jgi:hypothetical protein
VFPITIFGIFERYSSLGEDAAQLLNSVSLFHKQGSGPEALGISLYSPFVDFLSLVASSVSKMVITNQLTSILFVTVLIYIMPILIINVILVSQIKQDNWMRLISKFMLILIVNISLSPSILAGHISLLYSVALSSLAIIVVKKSLIRSLLLSLAILSWYPSGILLAVLVLQPVLNSLIREGKAAALKLANYIILILFIGTMSIVYYFLQESFRRADWKFDLLREEGGASSFPNLTIFIILIAFFIIVIFDKNYNIGLNLQFPYLMILSFILYILFNAFYVATIFSYGIEKLTSHLLLTLLIIIVCYISGIQEKVNLDLYLKFLIPILFVQFLVPGKHIDSFINLYSKSNQPSFSGISYTQFEGISKFLNSDGNYFILREGFEDSNRIDSYLSSRWISSLLGKDDRKLNNQMGWRFLLLNRIPSEDFFCCFNMEKANFISLNKKSFEFIDPEVIRLRLQ